MGLHHQDPRESLLQPWRGASLRSYADSVGRRAFIYFLEIVAQLICLTVMKDSAARSGHFLL